MFDCRCREIRTITFIPIPIWPEQQCDQESLVTGSEKSQQVLVLANSSDLQMQWHCALCWPFVGGLSKTYPFLLGIFLKSFFQLRFCAKMHLYSSYTVTPKLVG
ncbi:hypothetical protein CHARACLAT_022768 [Characodon lateralis]|uniref:Uncharacterized protein n=1 Tax=Characodon lateralis TaxID=208331 RepID=A0ABU7F6H3_9TELE|nr:hypothetical protein [Characodon lateralis]